MMLAARLAALTLVMSPVALAGPKRIADTSSGIHAFQVFDSGISYRQAERDAHLYVGTFGTGKPAAWHHGNRAFVAGATEYWSADTELGQTLGWWRAHHPDWVLYACDRKTPAYVLGSPYVPLDISNPAVLAFQVRTSAAIAHRAGQDGIGADTFSLSNLWGACGVFRHGAWRQLFSGLAADRAWATAAAHWAVAASAYLHGLARPLDLWLNFNTADRPVGDAATVAVLTAIDGDLNEDQFTNTLNAHPTAWQDEGRWRNQIFWMRFAQAHGTAVLGVQDLQTLDGPSLEYAISSYLLAKAQAGAIYAAQGQDYRGEHYHPEYDAAVGQPLGDLFGDQHVVWRRYTGALVVVNPSDTATYTVALPAPAYTDLEGATVTSPLTLGPHTGVALLPAGSVTARSAVR